jgi:xylulose-5-phosphate/fructose-6-phosphate phosphoketolase
MRSYEPETLFDADGCLEAELADLPPKGDRRMGANPHANGGLRLQAIDLPDFRDYAVDVPSPATTSCESTRQFGAMLRDTFTRNAVARNFRLFCPDETNSNRLMNVFDVENRCLVGHRLANDDHVAADGRVMEVLSEHLCEGWLEGHLLTGRHGLFATYESFAMVSASMTVQHAKWLEEAIALPWRAPVSSLNILLTSTCWRNDHNGFSHQGPGLIDVMLSKRGSMVRIYLPPDANSLLSVADHCLRSKNYVNLIVIDKQPQLQWLTMDAACEHAANGASVWEWASNAGSDEPDVVLACAGDTPTLETICGVAVTAARTGAQGARGQRRRSHEPVRAVDPSARNVGRALCRHLHARQAGDLRFPWLSIRSASARAPTSGSGALSRARVHGAGNHDDAVRYGRAEWDEPVPSRDARAPILATHR